MTTKQGFLKKGCTGRMILPTVTLCLSLVFFGLFFYQQQQSVRIMENIFNDLDTDSDGEVDMRDFERMSKGIDEDRDGTPDLEEVMNQLKQMRKTSIILAPAGFFALLTLATLFVLALFGSSVFYFRSFGLASALDLNYSQLSVLGAGAFGKVLKGKDKITGDYHALKVIRFDEPEVANNAIAEGLKLAKLHHHPHVVDDKAIYIHSRFNSMSFWEKLTEIPYSVVVAMEMCEGQDLNDYLWRKDRDVPDEDDLLELFRQTVDGVKAIHAANIVHADLKPENIFVTHEGQIKIGDLGLAEDIRCGEISRRLTGTQGFVAPERIIKAPGQDFRVDLWSLAVTLIEITGDMDDRFLHGSRITESVMNPGKRQSMPQAFRMLAEHAMFDADEICSYHEDIGFYLSRNKARGDTILRDAIREWLQHSDRGFSLTWDVVSLLLWRNPDDRSSLDELEHMWP